MERSNVWIIESPKEEEMKQWDSNSVLKSTVFKNTVYKINKRYQIIDSRLLENVSR